MRLRWVPWNTATAFVLGIVSVFLSWLADAISAQWGIPYFSMRNAIREYLLVPTWWFMLLGGWIAVLFGLVYGTVLYLSVRRLPS